MKKMKKLNLNKVRIVSLKNLGTLNGGATNACPSQGCPSAIQPCTQTLSLDNDINCDSTSNTHQDGGNGGGTFRNQTQACSAVLTECEIADR